MKFSSVPAYSFGLKTISEPLTSDKLNPGPGTYELRKEEIIVLGPVFSSADRPELFTKSDFPGPNHYHIENLNKSKSQKQTKITHSKEKTDKNKTVPPGPGAYNPQKLKNTVSYSMGNKVFSLDTVNMDSLGPGKYNPDYKSIHTSRTAKFSKTERKFNYETGTPGPGAYELPKPLVATTKIGSSERNKFVNNKYPGPGNYEVSRNLGGQAKSMTARRFLPNNNDVTPGPGTYDVKILDSAPAFALGSGNRADFIKRADHPGPGAYNPLQPQVSLAKSIGKGKRTKLENDNGMPGPGAYEFNNTEIGSGLKVSILGKRQENKINDNPGPGNYNPSIDYTKSMPVMPIIGTGLR